MIHLQGCYRILLSTCYHLSPVRCSFLPCPLTFFSLAHSTCCRTHLASARIFLGERLSLGIEAVTRSRTSMTIYNLTSHDFRSQETWRHCESYSQIWRLYLWPQPDDQPAKVNLSSVFTYSSFFAPAMLNTHPIEVLFECIVFVISYLFKGKMPPILDLHPHSLEVVTHHVPQLPRSSFFAQYIFPKQKDIEPSPR